MKKVSDYQINTKVYWNNIYSDEIKSKEYKSECSRFNEAVKYIKKGDKFLDIGCGLAVLAELIKKKGLECEIWGVDISDEVIKQNKNKYPEDKYYQGYIGGLNFLPENYFDVIFCGETIEHLDDPDNLFKEAYRFLKKGGLLIITTPVNNRIDSEEHIWSFDENDINTLFTHNGFEAPLFVELSDYDYKIIFFAVGEK